MPETISPTTEAELLEALAAIKEPTALFGANSKRCMSPGGPVARTIQTTRLTKVLQYEPKDLTISVESGMPWRELTQLLADNRQMVPLDPPYGCEATVGGVVASNSSGPRRRLYGTARDLVIGMRFATLEGKIARSGGMVVKNVAGLDMGKLLIGSFGTLAAIASVNFKLIPIPLEHRTFVRAYKTVAEAIAERDRILQSVLQPSAIDIVRTGGEVSLVVEAGGNSAMMGRYERDLGTKGDPSFDWDEIREATPRFLAQHPTGCVARVSATLAGLGAVIESHDGPLVARAGNGVCWLYFKDAGQAGVWADRAAESGWKFVFEYGMTRDSAVFARDFEMMNKVKNLFDPQRLLNPGRLYGRI